MICISDLEGPGCLPLIYKENPEIPVGNSNGAHHSIWSASEIMLKVMHFYYSFWDLQLMFIHFACYPSSELSHFVFMPKIFIRVVHKW